MNKEDKLSAAASDWLSSLTTAVPTTMGLPIPTQPAPDNTLATLMKEVTRMSNMLERLVDHTLRRELHEEMQRLGIDHAKIVVPDSNLVPPPGQLKGWYWYSIGNLPDPTDDLPSLRHGQKRGDR
ncbi:MAG: hypothetical protein KKF08_18905 [Gammaproteobacteria bacterium]|nr:hypothetical protein [Gammaproteobacteria bacterium]